MRTKRFRKKLEKTRRRTRRTRRTKRSNLKKISMLGGGNRYWEEIPLHLQVLSNRTIGSLFNKLKRNDGLYDTCISYDKNKHINLNYNLSEIDTESPLKVFKENENRVVDELEDGIHNFILCWDKIKREYVLATSFFKPYEYGSKHAMMSYRLNTVLPTDFIFSGEFKKNGLNEILFVLDSVNKS